MQNIQSVETMVRELCAGLSEIFPQDQIDAILFGSYARGDAEFGSDIDVLVLVDSSRQTISERSWKIGNLAGDFLLNYGIVVSPVVENREYYRSNAEVLPFYRNIQREGVPISA